MTERKSEITTIIFDCFGVLVSEGWLPFKHKYFDGDDDKFELATATQKRADAGLIDHADFVETVAALAEVELADAQKQIDSNVADQSLLEYIAELKPNYKIGFISNASQNWISHFFTPEQGAMFEAVSVSSETGFVKPDPRSYDHIAGLLNSSMEECVLIDDQQSYCDGARAVGMNAIVYTDLTALKKELAALLRQ